MTPAAPMAAAGAAPETALRVESILANHGKEISKKGETECVVFGVCLFYCVPRASDFTPHLHPKGADQGSTQGLMVIAIKFLVSSSI